VSEPIRSCSELVRVEWSRRVAAEYQSSAITQHLTLWLIQLGFPRELINDGLRIVADELDHAELSRDVFVASGGRNVPALERNQLVLPRHQGDPLERDLVRVCVRSFCIGETVAVPLFAELRAECSVPVAKAALDRVLRDEVRHRQFGWDLLGHLLESFPDARGWVTRDFPEYVHALRHLNDAGAMSAEAVGPEERSWGLMPSELYGNILAETVIREFQPRLSALAISVRV